MSGLYLYCIAPVDYEPPGGLRGIDDAPVLGVAAAGLTIWASQLAHRPDLTVERIRRHNAVVEAGISDEVTPLPLRFGQWLESAERLAQQIAERAESYHANLSLVAGAMEFGVRVADPQAVPAEQAARTVGSGREYLAELARKGRSEREVEERGSELAEDLRGVVGALARAEWVEPGRTPRGLLSLSHLVARHDFSPYRQAIEAFRVRHSRLRVLLSGPWPPYSFVS